MPEVSATENLNSLLAAYQDAERAHSQAVADVISAEIRRDAAEKAKDAALGRLEEARKQFSSKNKVSPNENGDSTKAKPANKQGGPDKSQESAHRRKIGRAESYGKRTSRNIAAAAKTKPKKREKQPKSSPEEKKVGEATDPSVKNKKEEATDPSAKNEKVGATDPRKGNGKKETADPSAKEEKKEATDPSERDEKEEVSEKLSSPPMSPEPVKRRMTGVIQSPRAGSVRAPKIFSGDARRKLSKIDRLTPLMDPLNVLEIAPGHTRDWYQTNFDCEECGLVKNFFRAAFGTKTSEKTKRVAVVTIVLNDEWNDLANSTSDIQEMYIGKSPESNGKPSLRDRAAEALVSPPQQDPVALFFAPKQKGKREIYYGGHWKVIDGKMLNPTRAVKGQERQCLAKFEFVGVDSQIINALRT